MRDISNRTVAVATQVPAVVTADANGTGVDLQGFESAMVVVNSGIEGDTLSGSVKFDFILEESNDDSTYTAVTSSTAVTEGSVDGSGIFLTLDANSETPQCSQIGYIGNSRYIRCKIDATGTHSNGTPIGVVVVKGNPQDSEDA
tara:strand:+ start:54 stop:485 length:432 start_codon:yes stop_codon:yes gene_type:complete